MCIYRGGGGLGASERPLSHATDQMTAAQDATRITDGAQSPQKKKTKNKNGKKNAKSQELANTLFGNTLRAKRLQSAGLRVVLLEIFLSKEFSSNGLS